MCLKVLSFLLVFVRSTLLLVASRKLLLLKPFPTVKFCLLRFPRLRVRDSFFLVFTHLADPFLFLFLAVKSGSG